MAGNHHTGTPIQGFFITASALAIVVDHVPLTSTAATAAYPEALWEPGHGVREGPWEEVQGQGAVHLQEAVRWGILQWVAWENRIFHRGATDPDARSEISNKSGYCPSVKLSVLCGNRL